MFQHFRFHRSVTVLLPALLCMLLIGCADNGGGDGDTPSVAYVTNGIASFWVIADKGAVDAGKDFNAIVTVQMPANGVEDQKRMCQDLLAQGIEGIAISPIDPDNQGDLLAEISQHTNLITQDSDAPDSDRLCYIGMDNYTAGRMCGALVKEAMPDGGSVMIFVGRLGQANARQRRQGVIDELMDREADSSRYDEPGDGEIKGDKYTILDTRTDGFDFGKAKAQAQDAIAKYDDLGCMVGLFAYNPPLMLDAVREAGKIGKIKIVAFDEEAASLQGIQDGEIHGTVVQNPYKYGYESVRVLAALARGDKSVIPEGGFLNIPARQIRKDNVEEFWAELKKLTATDEEGDAPSEEESTPDTEQESAAATIERHRALVEEYTQANKYKIGDIGQAVQELEDFIRVCGTFDEFEAEKENVRRYANRLARVGAIVAESKKSDAALQASQKALELFGEFAGSDGIPQDVLEHIREIQEKAETSIRASQQAAVPAGQGSCDLPRYGTSPA